uniref:Cupin domain-containing protein n=1 Tax=Candidatus Kentrum eta TaxID=2126337 RepID=A0A450UGP0_9GAMM|nr:MAG: Cupin domain-containing protein [Candidatus Kentron sp. H]VFJ91700.1 MAG: Cupin domain-containing protein [Candidatus Kentron sp. H]VFJ98336.1 MAG: Cupin domain-containing protein [Candidatus Kentron sp. H]
MQDSDIPPLHPPLIGNHSKVIRHLGDFTWQDMDIKAYKADTETWKGITRQELIGKRGESPRFHVRYFEVAVGGYTTLEKHRHEHVVIPVRGRGEAQLGRCIYHVGFGDVIYISPDEPHQLRNPFDAKEPFGFLCLVNAERDRPQVTDGPEVCYICE